MRPCKYRLGDGQDCGLDADDKYCRFHSRCGGLVGGGGAEAIREFIAAYVGRYPKRRILLHNIVASDLVLDSSTLRDTDFTTLDVCFSHSTFKGCSFRDLQFGAVDFSAAVFVNCRFINCTFAGTRTRFCNVICESDEPIHAIFTACTFGAWDGAPPRSTISFENAILRARYGLFNRCGVYAKEVSFERSHWYCEQVEIALTSEEPTDLSADMVFVGTDSIVLKDLVCRARLTLHGLGDSNKYEPHVSFEGVDFQLMGSAEMHSVNLTHARFLHSQLQAVQFDNPLWPTTRNGYTVLYDEVEPREEQSAHFWVLLQGLYIQLKRNYEAAGNYISAGHWFYREMEARRRRNRLVTKGRIRRFCEEYLFLSALYRYASNYGESQKRPLLALVLVWLAFSLIYPISGFQIGGQVVDYSLGWTSVEVLCKMCCQVISDWGNSLAFSLGVMTLQLGRGINAPGTLTLVVASIQMLCTAILASLAVLAVRRKFRR